MESSGQGTKGNEAEMSGADMVMRGLAEQGAHLIFGIPGGTVLPLFDALWNQKDVILARTAHEQGATHAAEGYARATGKVGVVLVTSGPGATNTVTGIMDAYADSTPIVVIVGQVPTSLIGTDAFQECNIIDITKACTKRNYQVTSVSDVPWVLREAFSIARSGRPGPVVVSIPKDVQMAKGVYYPADRELSAEPKTVIGDEVIARAVEMMMTSERPVFYTGGGVINSGLKASELLRTLVKETGFPVTSTLMGKGAYPSCCSQWLGMPGMHGAYEATMAMYEADLIVAVGARFDDRVTANVKKFAPNARKIHIDIDPRSINKIVSVDLGIQADCAQALDALLQAWRARKGASQAKDLSAWWGQIETWRGHESLAYENSDSVIKPQYAMQRLGEAIKAKDAYVVTDVGQHQMWVAQYLSLDDPNRFATSGGMGTMGYGLPAAIGVQMAHPSALVVCVSGDGGLEMSSHEMMTATREGLPVKIMLINNAALGMVRQWQEMFHGNRTSESLNDAQPDFVKLAEAYGWRGLRCESPQELDSALESMIQTEGPCLLDCRVDPKENCFPIIPPGAGHGDVNLRQAS